MDEVPSVSAFEGLLDILVSCLRVSEQDVLPNCSVEKDGLLTDISNPPAQLAEVEIFQVFAIDENLAVCGVIEAFDQLDHSAFA